jgi:hypothetical protein
MNQPTPEKVRREFFACLEQMWARAAQLPTDSAERTELIVLAKAFEQALDLADKDPQAANEISQTLRSMFENN